MVAELVAAYKQSLTDKDTDIDFDLLSNLIMHIHTNTPLQECILVFVPGYDDIIEIISMLEEESNLQIFALHSGMDMDMGPENEKTESVFDKMASGMRKIVVATNIAETSITIPDVVGFPFQKNRIIRF